MKIHAETIYPSETKNEILRAASSLFSQFGYDAVSMNDIAEKLHITKAALYYHFKNKREIYLAALDRSFNLLLKSWEVALKSPISLVEALTQVVIFYLDFCKEGEDLILSTFQKMNLIDKDIDRATRARQREFVKKIDAMLNETINKNKTHLSRNQRIQFPEMTPEINSGQDSGQAKFSTYLLLNFLNVFANDNFNSQFGKIKPNQIAQRIVDLFFNPSSII